MKRVAPPLLDWNSDRQDEFGRGVVTARQQLSRLPLFTDEALAALLDRHDRSLVDVCTMGRDPAARSSWRDVGVCRHLPGHHLMEAVHQTRLWVQVREALNTDPVLRPVFNALFDQLKVLNPDWKPLRAYGSVIIASPGAQVFLHSDVSETMMAQVRGTQRLLVYPPRQPWVSDEALERVLMSEDHGDLPYEPSWDAEAAIAEMGPGSFASWPLHAPHRIEMTGGISVTLALEVVTQTSLIRNGVLHANAVMRRAGWTPRSSRARGAGAVAKLALSRGVKAMSTLRAPASEPAGEDTPLAQMERA